MRTKVYKDNKALKTYVEEKGKLLKQQVFLSSYIKNEYKKIDRMLIFHGIGSGKTCSAISIAESIMNEKKEMKVLVILPARLKTNFIDELISESCGFNRYISKEDYDKYVKESTSKKDKDNIRKKFINKIEVNYAILSYESLRNILMKTDDLKKTIKKITDNKIIIIDEVHNLITSAIKPTILSKIIKDNKISRKPKVKSINAVILRLLTILTQGQENTKLFLLTATPVFDNYSQFIQLMLILRPDLDESKIKKTPSEIAKYINYLKGKVSFFKLKDRSDYPTTEKDDIRIVMSDTQRELINSIKVEEKADMDGDGDIDEDDEKANMFCVGERQLAISAYDYNKIDLILSDLNEYAPKLEKLFELIEKLKGKHLIYSNFIKYCLNLISVYLERNGWSNYTKSGIVPYKTFVLWDASLNDENKQKVKFILNSHENMDGKNIRVILGSPSIKEGVSFKHIQHLHQIDPVWNSSAKEQVEGRCIRYKSHDDIPLDHAYLKKKVIIHNYILVGQEDDLDKNGNVNLTCDAKIYDEIIIRKEKIIEIINELLTKIAIDYYLWTKDDVSPSTKSKSSEVSATKEKAALEELLIKKKGVAAATDKKKKEKEKPCPEGKIRNPLTGRCVAKSGKIGKMIEKGAIKPEMKVEKDKEKKEKKEKKLEGYNETNCLKWKKNKLINPITNRKIQEGKSVYNDFKKNCSHYKSPVI